MSIDWDKPVQTRDGREVRIYTREGQHPTHTLCGEYQHGGEWVQARWDVDGAVEPCQHTSRSLVNVPQQHTVTINVNRRNGQHQMYLCVHGSREEADDQSSGHRIACFEHTFTEGEGLE